MAEIRAKVSRAESSDSALTCLEPVLRGDQSAALFAHYQIGSDARIIFEYLGKAKAVSECDVSSNSLQGSSMRALAKFVHGSSQFTQLNLSNNPMVGSKALNALRRMSIMRKVMVVVIASFDVEVPSIPVSVAWYSLRTPVAPDTELCVTIPVGISILRE
jgi:hypothetical protein